MAKKVDPKKTVDSLRRQFKKRKDATDKNVDALAKGVFLALSNIPKKTTAKPPTRGGKFGGNSNYRPSSTPLYTFIPLPEGGTDKFGPIQEYIKILKRQRADITTRQKTGENQRLANQQKRKMARINEIRARIGKLENKLAKQFENDAQTVVNAPAGTYKWKKAKVRMQRSSARLEDSMRKAKKSLAALDKHHHAVTMGYKKRRRKPPKKFVFMSRVAGVRGTPDPQFNEIYRVGGKDKPKSWEGGNYFMRRRWRTIKGLPGRTILSIDSWKKQVNDNQYFLWQLEEGGSHMGGPVYEGYYVYFKQVGRFTHVTFRKKKFESKNGRQTVRVKPFHFVSKTLQRVRAALETHNLATMSNSQWRDIGRAAGN